MTNASILERLKAAYRACEVDRGQETGMWMELFGDKIRFMSVGKEQVGSPTGPKRFHVC